MQSGIQNNTRIFIFLLLILTGGILSPIFNAVADDTGRNKAIAIVNVRVFDGRSFTDKQTVVIENGRISAADTAEMVVDGEGGTLMPALIDSHVHIAGRQDLENAAQWGVATMLDMGTESTKLINSLRHLSGLPDIRRSGIAVAAAGGNHAVVIGSPVLTSPDEAEVFVAARAVEGVEYIKVIVDSPSPAGITVFDEVSLVALVRAAHERHLRVFAHITLPETAAMAARAGVDIITHTPQGKPIDPVLAAEIARKRMIAVPTLVMMKGTFSTMSEEIREQGVDYHNAEISVLNLHRAGIPVIAGTDANSAPGAPFNVTHGEALHDELELLVKAGLTPVEALRSATSLPAERFNLADRGVIEPGCWADLLLVDGDPTIDVTATRNIRGVWIAGKRVR